MPNKIENKGSKMITGSIVALVTPMRPNSCDVDWKALETLVEWHIAQGTHALVAVGTTGESATLSVKEHSQVIRATVEVSNGRIPVIAGTGANCTREAIELTEAAKEAGADACLLVTPYYNKPTQEGLYQHYKTVAETVDIDQILYNVPGRNGTALVGNQKYCWYQRSDW
jgi:4-hydroxy-tetrahydrodipicolinate synthase